MDTSTASAVFGTNCSQQAWKHVRQGEEDDGARVTYRLGLVLYPHGRCAAAAVAAHAPVMAPAPDVHGAADAALHVGGDLRLELWRLEEGAGEAVHPALEAAAEHQDGRLPHQLHERPRVPRHERRRVGLQHRAAHLRVRAHHRRGTPQVRLEHLAVPAHENNRRTHSILARKKVN